MHKLAVGPRNDPYAVLHFVFNTYVITIYTPPIQLDIDAHFLLTSYLANS